MNSVLALSIALTIVADTAYAVIVGTLLAGRWLDASDPATASPALAPRTRRTMLLVCVAAYAVVHLVHPWFLAASMSGSNDFGSDLALVPTILSSTHQGKLWFINSAAIVLLLSGALAIASGARQVASWTVLVGLVVIAFTKAASGHAADDGDFTLNEFSMFLHVLATAVWAGSVMVGGFVVLPRLVRDATHDVFWRFGSRLSQTVTWALAGLLISGIYTSDRELNNTLSALWTSGWGKVLITKVSFVIIAIALGAMSRFLCLGRAPESKRAALMVRLLTTEAALMVCILCLSGLLGNTAPAMSTLNSKEESKEEHMESRMTIRCEEKGRQVARTLLVTLLLVLLSLLLSLRGSAQETVSNASLTGRITDASGAVVANASVTVREITTNTTRTASSNTNGRFRFPYLPVGEYEVAVHQPGFSDVKRTIKLTIGAAFDLPVTLNVGATESTIDVSAGMPLLEADRSQVAGTVSQNEINELPFEGRNYLDLALLLPGVSPTNTASTQTLAETSEVVGQGYSVNSQRNFSNSFVVDGLSANDDAAGVAGNAFGMDVVREFQVVTSGGQAEFGRALGGYFNLVTKSGSNQLHGTAYGFLRNQRMNADNALSGSKLPLTQGQYGMSLSGPLRKDRTFLFGNFEEGRLNTNGVITVTPANAATINTRLTAVGYLAPLLPVGTGPTTRYPNTLHTDTFFVHADHQFSQSDQFSMRYSLYKLSSTNARGVGGLNEASNGTPVYDTNHTIAVSNVATLSPQTFNETRAQFTYDDLTAPPNDQIGPAVTISGVAIFGRSTTSPTARLNYLGEIVDNLVMQHGAHTLKTGVDVLYNDDSITYPQSLRGSYSFSSLASFLSGTYNSQGYVQNFGVPTIHQNNPNVGFYAQDEWKINPALTLNAGIRYDLEWLQTINTDKNNVSPRIGLAWSPHHGTVVRASYGLFYDRVPLRPLANALLSANNTIDPTRSRFLSYSFSTTDVNAPVFPAVAAASPTGAKPNYSTMDPNIQNPYSQQASLEVEQQVTASSTLGISYQHLRGLHLISSINTNINLDGTRPDPTRGNIKPYSSKFDSQYDGLAVTFVQRPVTWSAVRISYTWSKAIDNVGEFFFSSPINNFDLAVDRSRSDDDQRHRLIFNAAVNSPTSHAYTFIDHITHGWQLSGILQYYSRLPFNITTGANTKQATSQRPCAPGFSLTANGGLNPCTEALRGAVIGRNVGIGFDFFNLNARITRTFSLSDRVKLMGMAEAFNTLNHRNDMIPNATWGTGIYPTTASATFGKATAVGDSRSLQFALRLSF